MTKQSDGDWWVKLFEDIDAHLEAKELQDLCSRLEDRLGAKYDNLRGKDQVRELLRYGKRRGQAKILLSTVQELRPNVAWPQPPTPIPAHTNHTAQVQVELKGKLEDLPPQGLEILPRMLASVLHISLDDVSIVNVQAGSIIVTLKMFVEDAVRLMSWFYRDDESLAQLRPDFTVRNVAVGKGAQSGRIHLPGRDFVLANLSRANLSRANLGAADLRQANLSGADLTRANLVQAKLVQTNLHQADLSIANLIEADLGQADLSRAYLSRANLHRANLRKAYLSRARLHEANLSAADLHDANLSDAYLGEADLSQAVLSEANLLEANLRGANLIEADLSEANLIEANLSRSYLSWANLRGVCLIGADLSQADLLKADLRRADLLGAYLIGAELLETNLSNAELIGADLTRANLTRADLTGTDLSKANLRWAIVTDEQLAQAKSLQDTTLPDGSTHQGSPSLLAASPPSTAPAPGDEEPAAREAGLGGDQPQPSTSAA